MDEPTRLIRDATNRYKLKVSLPGGRYQLSLDDRAVAFLTDSLGYSERDTIPNPIVPVLVAMGDAWFPRERDVDRLIQDLSVEGHISDRDQRALREHVTSHYIQEHSVDRVLTALDRTPLGPLTEDDLKVKKLPSIPSGIDIEGSPSTTTGGKMESPDVESGSAEVTEEPEVEPDVDELREQFTRIPGIGPERSAHLARSEISSIEELAESRPTDLVLVNGISEGVAAVAIEGARERVGNVAPMRERLSNQTGTPTETFDKALSSLAASGIPPSEAAPVLRTVYGPTVGEISAVTGEQAYFLWEAGYQTPKDIVDASIEELENVSQLGSTTAPKIKIAAEKMLAQFD